MCGWFRRITSDTVTGYMQQHKPIAVLACDINRGYFLSTRAMEKALRGDANTAR